VVPAAADSGYSFFLFTIFQKIKRNTVMISIQDLSKRYGTHQVLKNINLNFIKGNIYGIVGENGAGKTTLFKCIAGLEKFDGSITSEFDKLKNHLGFLQTEPFFFSKITGREYIRLLCKARGIKPENIDARNIFNLPMNQYASTYSTGMKKKLAFMAILLQENDVYILDEPFNGVDIQSNLIITDIIHKLKQVGKTALISSHIFSTLSDTCDEIHLLKEGEFVRQVYKDEFKVLEKEMREVAIGDKIVKLGIK
jgi:ABC-2 type transport system ATP-binding protein